MCSWSPLIAPSGAVWKACVQARRTAEKDQNYRGMVLGATAVVVAVTKALEKSGDAQTHAMILSPREIRCQRFEVRRRKQ